MMAGMGTPAGETITTTYGAYTLSLDGTTDAAAGTVRVTYLFRRREPARLCPGGNGGWIG